MTSTTLVRGAPQRGGPTGTQRRDAWWVAPTITVVVLTLFVGYSTYAAFAGDNFFFQGKGAAPYLSPFYSPCITEVCGGHIPAAHYNLIKYAISPALVILPFPLLFRLTCYYYRKAYYRGFWMSPPACAVTEPRKGYTGESRFPLILQNSHRYWFYFALIFNVILTWDAVDSFRGPNGAFIGVGTLVLTMNAVLLWLYTASCHSCRHILGGRLNNFSRHPLRYRFWTFVSRLNPHHMTFAWASLVWVGLTDFYIRALAAGWIPTDPKLFT